MSKQTQNLNKKIEKVQKFFCNKNILLINKFIYAYLYFLYENLHKYYEKVTFINIIRILS